MGFKDTLLMPTGKYKGVKITNVPPDYLLYLYKHGMVYGDVKHYIKENINGIKEAIKKQKFNSK